MNNFAKSIVPISIEQELKESYMTYAMSVIVTRALPDVRDGLKPVHRRVLYAMHELRNDYNKPHKKSARVVGDVIGKYHPHGDSAVYDAIVRMAQDFSLRYPLIDGQGNFGSIDGDSAAAMRYTEIRMAKITHSLLADLEKDTVKFLPNYDNTEYSPEVFPTMIPNLLINGSAGIAVGMATNIPPHNLGEVIDACLHLMHNSEADLSDLMTFIKGPDFPTAAMINGRSGIRQAYETGRGKIYLRSKAEIVEDSQGKETIEVTELPFQVNKARLIEKISLLVKEKKVEGISALRDESDKDGVRVVIEVRRGTQANVLLNQLYSLTQLQVVFGINMVALDHGQPKCLTLKQTLSAFIAHRQEVVTRRTLYDLRKARERAHLLEGLALSLSHIDEIVALIKAAASPQEAKAGLIARSWPAAHILSLLSQDSEITKPDGLDPAYGLKADVYNLSPEQAQAILDLKLHRLTGMERDKIDEEYRNIIKNIVRFLEILRSHSVLLSVIEQELKDVREQFADERKTKIIDLIDYSNEDLIPKQQVVVTISNEGYAKSQLLEHYQAQRRGGKGKSSANMKESDYVKYLKVAESHDTLLMFTSHGKLYWKKVYEFPLVSRQSRGKPVVNFLPLAEGEYVSAILPVKNYDNDEYIVMATRNGKIKKVHISNFSRPRSNGIIAIALNEDDLLLNVALATAEQDLLIFNSVGKVIRFSADEVRKTGRGAQGVRAMKLQPGQNVISMIVVADESPILTVTKFGYGKRTKLDNYRKIKRGGQGVIAIQLPDEGNEVIGALQVADMDEIMLMTEHGSLIRMHSSQISLIGRNTQGVRLASLGKAEVVVDVQSIVVEEEVEEEVGVEADHITGDIEVATTAEEGNKIEPSDQSSDN